ncbi:MAG: hypothetical protein OEV42_00670 [Deltaproteobacteria bacterium]|nr:hypothetical protein [Deltaproteobacteria bacterium]
MAGSFFPQKVKSIIRKVASLAVLSFFMLYGEPSFAAAPHNVAETSHNLSSELLGGGFGSNVTEICVFCHTPHNGNLSYPLWNRYSTIEREFTLYSSFTLDADMPANLAPDSASRLCLSCHDGVTAINALVRYGSFGFKPTMSGGAETLSAAGENTANLGTSLRDDHPVGFDYADAQSRDSGLRNINDVKAGDLKFFGANGNMLECGTCHDPHVDYDYIRGFGDNVLATIGDRRLRPFLRISNQSSQLCFTCHIK